MVFNNCMFEKGSGIHFLFKAEIIGWRRLKCTAARGSDNWLQCGLSKVFCFNTNNSNLFEYTITR